MQNLNTCTSENKKINLIYHLSQNNVSILIGNRAYYPCMLHTKKIWRLNMIEIYKNKKYYNILYIFKKGYYTVNKKNSVKLNIHQKN